MRIRPELQSLTAHVWSRFGAAAASLAACSVLTTTAALAAAPTIAPQVLLAITNSQSMDGTTAGAIMVGSGSSYGAGLTGSSSPINYSIPTGFVPPLNAGSGGLAPFTSNCGAFFCDNGPSRMNLAKAAIQQALNSYGEYLNFGLYTFSASGAGLYTTWVYHMSPNAGFSFTNTASATTVANPCYQYSVNTNATVKANCTSISGRYPASFGTAPYMNVSISSDNPLVNDVLYAPAGPASVFVDYSGPNPATPYPPNYSLSSYNNGSVNISYNSVLPTGNPRQSGPTNAGYVPYTPEVMYSARGFGYYATSYSSSSGKPVVAMSQPVSTFAYALAPETSNSGSLEVKSLTSQAPTAGLLSGAKTYLAGLTKQACQAQYVVLLTDGLPTSDLAGKNWPPLGSAAAAGYGVTATFNSDGTLASTNNVAVSDAITAVAALKTAGIKTYVIGLGAGVDRTVNAAAANTLQAMAIAGGTTNFFPATDPASLNAAFLTIVDQIYKQSSIAAPIAPITVKSGTALEYSMTTDPTPRAGFVKAYAVDAAGLPAASATWDAADLMSTTSRTAALRSTATDGTIKTLAAMDDAAYNLPATKAACVPDVATVRNFTINPSYTQASCSYISDRRANWFLGSFSSQNIGKYVGPPSSAPLATSNGYSTYVASVGNRPPMLLFTNSDGFLYAVDARTGVLMWGWTPRSVLGQMQNYSTFQLAQWMDGGFSVVDAKNSGGSWGSYVVGSAQSGAEHFSLKLDGDGMPTSVVYDTIVASGSAPGDKAGATGSVPLHQTPQFVFLNGNTFAVYVVNVGSSSTLYEVNVATGATTSANLSFTLSSALYVDPQFNRLWAGTSTGQVWKGTLTGNAGTDAAAMNLAASTLNPADNVSVVTPVLYVGYTEFNGLPYMYAGNASQLTAFSLTATGWKPIWATTTASGYSYNTGFTANTALTKLVAGSVVSDALRVDGSTMIVPLFVPPTGCGLGTGYYAFFDLTSGKFPTTQISSNGTALTATYVTGPGQAYTPSVTVTKNGISLNPGAAGNLTPQTPLTSPTRPLAPISWQQR